MEKEEARRGEERRGEAGRSECAARRGINLFLSAIRLANYAHVEKSLLLLYKV